MPVRVLLKYAVEVCRLNHRKLFQPSTVHAGGEVEQILQGVTDWVSSMVDDNADPYGDAAMVQHSGELSSITAHVAEVISQMAGSLARPDQDMDVEITYEFDLGVRAADFIRCHRCAIVVAVSNHVYVLLCWAVG